MSAYHTSAKNKILLKLAFALQGVTLEKGAQQHPTYWGRGQLLIVSPIVPDGLFDILFFIPRFFS